MMPVFEGSVMPRLEVVLSRSDIWSQLRASAEEAARAEPHLGSLLNATVLSHTDLAVVMEKGQVAQSGSSAALLAEPDKLARYLGV